MKAAAILAGLLAISASPAFAQHSGHPMPPAEPAIPPVAPPAAQPAPSDAPAAADAKPATPRGDPAADSMAGLPGMEGMDHGAADEEVGDEPPPPVPADFAADRVFDPAAMARARAQLQMEHGGSVLSKVMVNLGELQIRDGENGYRWEGEAWVGGDLNRFVVKTEGEGGDELETAEVQALYSRAVSPYFDLQVGLRQDLQSGPKRTYATAGFEGLAPYWFETSGALFLSSKGELLARLEGSYDLRLTQRWILEPRVEANLTGQDIPELELGPGVSSIELGLRLRYEIKREFAPYVGVSFDRKFGDTADYARIAGEDVEAISFVIGVRAWF